MSFEDLHAQGAHTFASLVPGGEERLAKIFRLAPDLAEMAVGTVYGHLHHRPALDPRTREAVALSAILAAGMHGTPLGVQLRTGMASGLASAEIVEILLVTAAFGGFPRAVSALEQVEEAIGAAGGPVPPGPSPRQIVLDACTEIRESDGVPDRSDHADHAEHTEHTEHAEHTDHAPLPGATEEARGSADPLADEGGEDSAPQENVPTQQDETSMEPGEPAWRQAVRRLLADCPEPWIQTIAPDQAIAVFGPADDRAEWTGPSGVVHFRVSGERIVSAHVLTGPDSATLPASAPYVASSTWGAPATSDASAPSAASDASAPSHAAAPAAPQDGRAASSAETLAGVLDYLRSTHPVPAETTHGDTRSVPDPDVLEDLEPVRFLLAQGARPVIRDVDAAHVTAAIPTGDGDTAVVLARLEGGAVTRVTVLHPGS